MKDERSEKARSAHQRAAEYVRLTKEGLTAYFEQGATDGRASWNVEILADLVLHMEQEAYKAGYDAALSWVKEEIWANRWPFIEDEIDGHTYTSDKAITEAIEKALKEEK